MERRIIKVNGLYFRVWGLGNGKLYAQSFRDNDIVKIADGYRMGDDLVKLVAKGFGIFKVRDYEFIESGLI